MDSNWKFSNVTVFGMWSFLYLAGTAPNVGARPERREEERWMNEPRGSWGFYIGGGGRWPPN
jgi:hypothetical protein